MPSRRIGLLGGTFDPIHKAHLAIASLTQERLALDSVIFIPIGISPTNKQPTATPKQRLDMTNLACQSIDKPFFTSDFEIVNPRISYTYLTLSHFRDLFPVAHLYWIIGADLATHLPSWHHPDEILNKSNIVIYHRDGHGIPPNLEFNTEMIPVVEFDRSKNDAKSGRIYSIGIGKTMQLSSTKIRQQLKSDKLDNPHALADKVIKYIKRNKLYE